MVPGDRAATGQKTKKPKPKKLSQKEQSERFIEAARQLGVDESGLAFEAASRKILSKKVKT